MNYDEIGSFRMFDVGEPACKSNRPEEDGCKCPSCGFEYVDYGIPFHDKDDEGRNSHLVIPFVGECGHRWELVFEFHKGNTCSFIRVPYEVEEEPIDYHAYIESPAWRMVAEAAKERAGHKCQTCNAPRNTTTLDAHHRTYERLGNEAPEDITVLCRDCHSLFSKNKKLARPTA